MNSAAQAQASVEEGLPHWDPPRPQPVVPRWDPQKAGASAPPLYAVQAGPSPEPEHVVVPGTVHPAVGPIRVPGTVHPAVGPIQDARFKARLVAGDQQTAVWLTVGQDGIKIHEQPPKKLFRSCCAAAPAQPDLMHEWSRVEEGGSHCAIKSVSESAANRLQVVVRSSGASDTTYEFATKGSDAQTVCTKWESVALNGQHIDTVNAYEAEIARAKREHDTEIERAKRDHDAELQAQAAEIERRENARQQNLNIKQRLDEGEWRKARENSRQNDLPWWGGDDDDDKAMKINQLRAMTIARSSWQEGTGRGQLDGRWPELVVVGDVSTGKSTVLNRFANFDFTAVSMDVCTRRPVRLKLRSLSPRSREVFDAAARSREPLDAICTLQDYRNNNTVTPRDTVRFELHAGEQGKQDRRDLRQWVERRMSDTIDPELTTAQDRHDSRYLMDELVIQIETERMIHFDLVDLPGVENFAPMTERIIRNYINAQTYEHTFVLVFQNAASDDTRMRSSVCLKVINDLQVEIGEATRQDTDAMRDWMKTHCLGVLTKMDVKMENQSRGSSLARGTSKSALSSTGSVQAAKEEYNQRYARELFTMLRCEDHEEHMSTKFPWVAVLNANPEECLEGPQRLDFKDVYQKEEWFFEELLCCLSEEEKASQVWWSSQHKPITLKGLCGIGSLRSILIDRFALFMIARCRDSIAPQVFGLLAEEEKQMKTKWGWTPEEEEYHDPDKQKRVLHDTVAQMLEEQAQIQRNSLSNFGKRVVLSRPEFQEVFNTVFSKSNSPRSSFSPISLVSSDLLLKPVKGLADAVVNRLEEANSNPHFNRFPRLMKDVTKACELLSHLCQQSTEVLLTAEAFRMERLLDQGGTTQITVPGLLYIMQKKLLDIAQLIDCLRDDQRIPFELIENGLSRELLHQGIVDDSDPPATTDDTGLHRSDRSTPQNGAPLNLSHGSLAHWLRTQAQEYRCTLKERLDVLMDTKLDPEHYLETALVDYENPSVLSLENGWLMPLQLNPEYKLARDLFMKHRRAAELIRLFFSDATKPEIMADGSAWPPARAGFDASAAAERPLLRMGPWTHMEPQPNGLRSDLPGQCCSPHCSRPHDAACDPCGHAVCCWECLQIREECPICAVPICTRTRCYENDCEN